MTYEAASFNAAEARAKMERAIDEAEEATNRATKLQREWEVAVAVANALHPGVTA